MNTSTDILLQKQLKVIFLHGLHGHGSEKSSNDAKAKYLANHFNTLTPNLKISNMKFEPNSIFVNIYHANKFPCGLFVFTILMLLYYLFNIFVSYFNILFVIYLIFLLKRLFYMIRSRATQKTLDVAIEIAKSNINSFNPDVIVGFGFGGAVLYHLIKNNIWNKPSIMIAPTQGIIERYINGQSDYYQNPAFYVLKSKVIVIHSKNDQKVPFIDSENLIKYSDAQLIEINDTYKMNSLIDKNLLKDYVSNVIKNS
jgi:hypothetical protein